MHFEYVPFEDLYRHARAGEARAAASLAEMFSQVGAPEPALLNLVGVFWAFRWTAGTHLEETVLTLAGDRETLAWTVQFDRRLYQISDPDYFREASDNLDPVRYQAILDLLAAEPDPTPIAKTTADGIGVRARSICSLLLGGQDAGVQCLIAVEDIHLAGGVVAGFRARALPSWRLFQDGVRIGEPNQDAENTISAISQLFYPQEIIPPILPFIDEKLEEDQSGETPKLDFVYSKLEPMDRRSQQIVDAETIDVAAETALAACVTEDDRLETALDLWRVDAAIAAVEAGADLNRPHSQSGLPMIHMAAMLGMRGVLEAMVATGRSDLTVRDRFGRLASTCAATVARDGALCDWLIEQEAKQFEAMGKSPHREISPRAHEPGR